MRPVPTVSQRQYATASAQDTPSSAPPVARSFSSHSLGGDWCVSSTNIAYSAIVTGLRAMAKTFTCSVRGGSPSNASPAGTTTTSGSIIAGNPTNSRGGVRARGSTCAGGRTHLSDRCCHRAALRAYGHELPGLRSGLEREAHLVATDAGDGHRAGQHRDARRLQHPRRHRERLLRDHRERRQALATPASRLTPGPHSCASPSPPAPAADEESCRSASSAASHGT